MPKRVTAWACEFGCHRRVRTDRKAVERHERTCFFNPARRSCRTCRHEIPGFVDDVDPVTGYHYEQARECGVDALPEPTGDSKDPRDPIRWDCPQWERKPPEAAHD